MKSEKIRAVSWPSSRVGQVLQAGGPQRRNQGAHFRRVGLELGGNLKHSGGALHLVEALCLQNPEAEMCAQADYKRQ